MKQTLFLMAIGVLSYSTSRAQSSNVIRIKGGTGGEKAAPFADRYQYDRFLSGKVLFRDGTSASAWLNYNIILGEMQFIDARGDTLAVADETLLRFISINAPAPDRSVKEDLFVHDQKNGYLQILADYNGIKLADKQGLRLAKSEKQGGYGQSSGSSAITTYQFYSPGSGSVSKLDGQGDLVLIKDKMYFIIDKNNRSYLANKASIAKVFSKHREQVATYLTSESVDFRQEDDLKKLLKYCSELL